MYPPGITENIYIFLNTTMTVSVLYVLRIHLWIWFAVCELSQHYARTFDGMCERNKGVVCGDTNTSGDISRPASVDEGTRRCVRCVVRRFWIPWWLIDGNTKYYWNTAVIQWHEVWILCRYKLIVTLRKTATYVIVLCTSYKTDKRVCNLNFDYVLRLCVFIVY